MPISINHYGNKNHLYHSIDKTSDKNPKHSIYKDLKSLRYHNKNKSEVRTKTAAAIGSVAGTLIPILLLSKKQNGKLTKLKDLFKINFGLKEMLTISAGSIIGGVGAGLLFDKKENRKPKINEGFYQFMNASIPPSLVYALMNITKKTKHLNNIPGKIASTAVGLATGIPLANVLANKINDPKNIEPDRKITLKDSIANIDDALGVLVMAKIPGMNKLPFDKILPAIYALCGYRAGQSN